MKLDIEIKMKHSEMIVKRIEKLCKERHISYNRLAEMSGVGQSTIDNIMQHNSKEPRYITLHRIALAFGMTPAEFLNFNEMNEFSFDEVN